MSISLLEVRDRGGPYASNSVIFQSIIWLESNYVPASRKFIKQSPSMPDIEREWEKKLFNLLEAK